MKLTDEQLVELLKDAALRLGHAVVTTPLASGEEEVTVESGACRLKGQRLILLDRRASAREKRIALVAALAGEELSGIYLPPAVRRLLESAREKRSIGDSER